MHLSVDLHSHSGHAGGVGNIRLEDIARAMRKKGIDVFGTGDCLHADADFGNVDTVLSIAYCDTDVAFSDFSGMLETVELVEDRAAFSEALRKKLNAMPGGFRGGGREA